MPRVLVDLLSYTGTKGGMETYTRELYRALGELPAAAGDPAGYEYLGYASREAAAMDLSWFPGRIIESGISGENRFTWAWGELSQVARAAKRHRADLIHSPATLGPPRTSVPAVVTMHDVLYWSHPEYMSTPMYTAPVKWIEWAAARNATEIITISPTSADEIVKYLKVDRRHLHVVPNAQATLEGVDRSLAGSEGPLILAMGNRRPHKNYPALVRALTHLEPEQRPRVIITGGRGDDPLEPLVRETGTGDWVELRGWIDEAEMRRLYSVATAFAIPSVAEGFSLPAIEAMGAGVPVLLSDIDVHRYVGGEAAVYFDPAVDADLARAILAITTDPALRERLVPAGVAQAAQFTWERCARETRAVFDLALAGH